MGKRSISVYESFIKNYDENGDKGYFLEVDVKYPKNSLAFMKILYLADRKKKKNRKSKKACLWNTRQQKYAVHIRALKEALNHGLILRKVHRVIQFNQNVWLKPFIDMNNKLRKETKMNLKRISLS